jgi:hypothetical protein
MRRLIVSSLVALIALPGCIARDRVNTDCEWIRDAPFPIDPQDAAHHRHLVADAQLAEELAIRYADHEHKRLFGSEGHGGLIEQGRLRQRCMSRMVEAIKGGHGVTAEQIEAARGERNRALDAAAALLFVPVYCLAAAIACRRIGRRFSSSDRGAGLTAVGVASLVASAVGLQSGQLWLSVWEAARVGNGHMSSFRAATQHPWPHDHVGALFAAGVALFWLVALWRVRFAPDVE